MLKLFLLSATSIFIYAEVVNNNENVATTPLRVRGERCLEQFGPMESIFTGPHDSYHYNPEGECLSTLKPLETHNLDDVYAHPRTGCALGALLKEWQKNHCPNLYSGGPPDLQVIPTQKRNCRVAFGDIASRWENDWDDHETHDSGYCVDFRPFRKDKFDYAPLDYKDPEYDLATTVEFLRFVKKYGASNMFFNDPDILNKNKSSYVSKVSSWPGHAYHFHVCFEPNDIPESVIKNNCPHLAKDKIGKYCKDLIKNTAPGWSRLYLPDQHSCRPIPTPEPRPNYTPPHLIERTNRGPR